MNSTNFDLQPAIDVLRRTPSVLDAMLRGIDDAWARASEGTGTFSPFDVVGHLIDGEETDWIPRALLIRARDTAPFTPYDRFRHRERNVDRTLDSLLDELPASAPRTSSCSSPGSSPTPSSISAASTRPSAPSPCASCWPPGQLHDLGHIAQVARVMAKHYRDDVGPWKQFLPVLGDRE